LSLAELALVASILTKALGPVAVVMLYAAALASAAYMLRERD